MVTSVNGEGEAEQGQEPRSGRVVEIDRQEAKDVLRAFRQRRAESPEIVETRLTEKLKRAHSDRDLQQSRLYKLLSAGGLEAIERGGPGTIPLSISDLELVADAYGISRLMVQPLLTRQCGHVCVQQSLDDFIPADHCPGAGLAGKGATYRVPQKKLQGTHHIAIVHLEIEPGGRSDVHSHVGDELIFVLEGAIEMRLANNGLWTRLKKGDYIHFYAEQEHSAWNLGKRSARVFIVRFYQLEKAGMRFAFLQELQDNLKILKESKRKGVKKPNVHSLERALNAMTTVVRPFDLTTRHEAATEVIDTFGMGRLLKLLCSKEFRGEGRELRLNDLAGKCKEKGFTRTKIHRLHSGMARATRDQLPILAAIHDVEPMLLYDFLFPALRIAVAVRQPHDMHLIPEEFVNRRGIRYRVPCRRLADSNVAIAILDLERRTKTPDNRHPGHELLLPLEGAIKVETRGITTNSIRANETLYAHFSSKEVHRVSNAGNDPARVFLIRFYE